MTNKLMNAIQQEKFIKKGEVKKKVYKKKFINIKKFIYLYNI